MLYQPTNISPSMLGPLGNGVVDANDDFIVSWQVNGNSPMTAFRIQIYTNDSKQTEVYDSGRIMDGCPFYGTDYAGNQKMFEFTVPRSDSLKNGKDYKLIITQWWGNDSEYVRQMSSSAFIARSKPTVDIVYSNRNYETARATFYAKYAQYEGDTLNLVRWQVATVSNEWEYGDDIENIIADTGNIYGTSELQYTFDGIFQNQRYAIQCMVQTENGATADSGWADFRGAAPEELEGVNVDVCADAKSNGIRLTFPECTSIMPDKSWYSATGTIDDGKLYLETADGIVWDILEKQNYNFSFAVGADVYTMQVGNHTYADGLISIRTFDFETCDMRYADLSVAHLEISVGSPSTISGSASWRIVVYGAGGGGIYVALGDAGVAYSTDAKTWTMATIPAALSQDISSLFLCGGGPNNQGNNLFLLASSSTATAAYSSDGVTWATTTMQGKATGIAYCDGVAYVSFEDGSIASTYYGNTWESVEIGGYNGTSPLSGAAYGNGVTVILREDGMIAYSEDRGFLWNLVDAGHSSSDSYKRKWLCFGNGMFLYRKSTGGAFGTWNISKNGVTWEEIESYFSGNAPTFGGSAFVAGGSNKIKQSTNGTLWFDETTDSGTWNSGCYNGDTFVFVGDNGKTVIADTYVPIEVRDNRGSSYTVKLYAEKSFSLYADGSNLYYITDGNSAESSTPIPFSALDDAYALYEIVLGAPLVCDFLMVLNGTVDGEDRLKVLHGTPVQSADKPMYFYANFLNGLDGGQYGTTGFNKFSIYRRESEKSTYHYAGSISAEEGNVFIDASAVNGKTYTYYAYGDGEKLTNAVISDSIQTCGWDWQVLACTQDEAGAYHVQKIFRFSNNVSSGSVTNNAAPSVLQNFTRYPTIQNSPWNYRSGTLTSLIGYTADGKYYDTKELRDEITALTTSDYTLFLKNRKGDLIHIAISGAVEMETMDGAASQAQTMKLPWTEVGDASDAQVVITKNDGAYLQAIPSPVVGSYCGGGSGASRSFAYPLTVLQSSGTTVYDGSEAKKVVIKDGGSGGIVAEDDGNGNITIY